MKKGKLGDLCIVIAGQSPQGSAYNDKGVGIEFHQGKKAFGESYLTPSNVWTTEITKIAEPLDILMSVRAPVGPTNITDRRICIGRGLAAIRCKDGVLQKFILYALRNIESKIVGNDGAVFNSINKAQIEALPVPIIPLPEQERIVSLLDAEFAKIDAIKANAEKQLQDAKALFQSALQDLSSPKEGWRENSLGEIATDMYRGHGITRAQVTKDGISCVRYGEIYTTYDYHFNTCVSHTDETNIQSRKYFEYGDILFAITGESVEDIGKSVAYLGHERCLAGGDIVVMKHTLNPKFLGYVLSAPYVIKQKGFGKTKLKVVHTNVPSLKSIIIYYPPSLSAQHQIAEQLDNISAKIHALQSNFDTIVTLCNDLKQSILKDIFG